jgi:hypothetical protein
MTHARWGKIIEDYKTYYMQPRYKENTEGLIALVSRIKDDDAFEDFSPGISLGNLFLELPERETTIRVWCEHEGLYSISLHTKMQASEKVNANDKTVIPILKEYLLKVRLSK